MSEASSLHLALYSRSLCCHVRSASTGIVLYYLGSSLLVLALTAASLITGWNFCGLGASEQVSRGQQMFLDGIWQLSSPLSSVDVTSNILLLVMMTLSSISALVGLYKRSPHHMVPLIVLLFLDMGLTVMSTVSSIWGLPGTPSYDESEKTYLTTQRELNPRIVARFSLAFGILFVLYLLMKVFMVNTLLRCYFVMKAEGQERTVCEKSVLVDLPTYEEAIKLPSKDPPLTVQGP
ncbi:mtp family protein isoform X1 [Brienomyrus brachyistius]|uniref:mtp family protein isoform X1 n=1 Tax=Brienomyrus brachyistius TaxID=42636 RepID=UPI0020B1886A|nr:mtp family protein isoform X1 [Brienomyrus brachyistius]